MVCNEIAFSDHAVSQMFKRDISLSDVRDIIANGEIITVYLYDRPFSSNLILGYAAERPIHIVVAKDDGNSCCVVITAYEPDINIWQTGFKIKK